MTGRRLLAALVLAALAVLAGCSTGGGATTTVPPSDASTTVTDAGVTTAGGGSGTTVDGDAVRADVLASIRAVEEYRAVVNRSVRSTTNNIARNATVDQVIAVDRDAPAYRVAAVQRVLDQSVETHQYLLNGTVYTRGAGNVERYGSEWTRVEVAGDPRRALLAWDRLALARQLLTNATVSIDGRARLGGTPVTLLRVDVDESAYADVVSLSNGSSADAVTAVYYVDRADGRVHRVDLRVDQTRSLAGRSVDQRIETTLRLQYTPVSVTLPAAAADAVRIDRDDTTTAAPG